MTSWATPCGTWLGRFGRGLGQVHGHHGDHVLGDERRLTVQHLVHENAECVQIRTRIHLAPAGLFGRHVFRCPDDGAGLGKCRSGVGVHVELGHAEVQYLDNVRHVLALEEHHVVGFQIAMDDADLVSGVDATRNLSSQDQHSIRQ